MNRINRTTTREGWKTHKGKHAIKMISLPIRLSPPQPCSVDGAEVGVHAVRPGGVGPVDEGPPHVDAVAAAAVVVVGAGHATPAIGYIASTTYVLVLIVLKGQRLACTI